MSHTAPLVCRSLSIRVCYRLVLWGRRPLFYSTPYPVPSCPCRPRCSPLDLSCIDRETNRLTQIPHSTDFVMLTTTQGGERLTIANHTVMKDSVRTSITYIQRPKRRRWQQKVMECRSLYRKREEEWVCLYVCVSCSSDVTPTTSHTHTWRQVEWRWCAPSIPPVWVLMISV